MTLGPDPAADPDATPVLGIAAGAVPPPGQAAGPAGPPPSPRTRASQTWHRFHYAVGVFLIAYGVTGLASAVALWDDRRDEIDAYFGSGPVTAVLVLAKLVEAALVLSAVAGVVLRRDLLFVPSMAGWMAGFAMFAVLDVFTTRWGGLFEHLLYLAGFVALLFLSYGLSAKAQLAGAPRRDVEPGSPRGPNGLTRTQEFALQAINRAAALRTGPRPRPEQRG
ncbi:hypothetical protein GCM10022254_20840 [Actinomadura meridiana]|uniref:DoxX family protein n=1 Tax=Actinomadura meridiana TaxID=559626 RepID=A0ABP8BX23_9ACTN